MSIDPGVSEAAVRLLRRHGQRVTPVRTAVLGVLDRTREHLDAEEIVRQVARLVPGAHRASIYRTLSSLSDLGVITHTHVAGAAAVYHLSRPESDDDSHTHLQCTVCGRLFDLPVAWLAPLTERVRSELDFSLEPRHAALLGICADCRDARG